MLEISNRVFLNVLAAYYYSFGNSFTILCGALPENDSSTDFDSKMKEGAESY